MKILNLTNNETSDIKFEVSKFPDGQQQVKVEKGIDLGHSYVLHSTNRFPIQIKSRLNNFRDLELIICTVASLRNLGVKEIHLFTPYFLGSRSDRKFEEGSNNYLKDVICPIINSLNFESVTVLDPHSDVLEACLNNFKKVDNLNLVTWSIANCGVGNSFKDYLDKFILISPDAGANKKIFKLAEQISYTGEIITCSKSRDENGKLTKTEVPVIEKYSSKNFIIIDDICDGGATFINIADKLRTHISDESKIYLIVTHGIFSKGFDELNKYFDGLYCTDSYRDICDIEYDQKTNVKQLKVF